MKYLFGILMFFLLALASAQDTNTKDESLKRPDIPGELMVDVGFNLWSSMPGATERRTWASKSISVYYMKRKALSGKLSFYYGVGLGMEKMSLGDTVSLSSAVRLDDSDNDPDTDSLAAVAITTLPDGNFDKNKLATTYLDIPVEFRFHPFGTQDGEGLFLGVGGIVGVRINAHTKWKYDRNGETSRQKISGDFNLNSFRYGYQIRAGFRGIHLFYKGYVSDVFNDPFPDGSNPMRTTIGINITGF